MFFGLVRDSDDKLLVLPPSLTLAPIFSRLRTPSAPKGSDSDDVVIKLIFAFGLQKANFVFAELMKTTRSRHFCKPTHDCASGMQVS